MEQNSKNTALLVMDFQAGVIARLADAQQILNTAASAIATARSKTIPVIYITLNFREGLPEISDNNKSFHAFRPGLAGINMEEFTKIDAAIAPVAGEIVVTKRRVSAFSGSDLEIILRAQKIDHLILAGISTSGVVLSTLREAADKDYRLTVLADCCADLDDEVHRVLTTKIFPRQAQVLNTVDWIQELNGPF